MTGKDVEDLKARLLDAKRSPKRINNVSNVLSKIFRYAIEIELADRMPRIKTLKGPPQKFDFFTFEELEALVANSANEPDWHAAVLVAGEAGLRLGEMLALEWTDIDFKNRHEPLHEPGARGSCAERDRAARDWATGGRQFGRTSLSS